MISISATGLAYRIGVNTIISDVSFSLEDGDKLGIVGVNGSGKSTLMRMLIGEYTPDDGEVFVAKDHKMGILHQDDAFNIIPGAGDTVLEQMYAAFSELLEDERRLSALEEEMKREKDEKRLTSLSGEFDTVNRRYTAGGGLYFRSRCVSMLKALGFDEKFHSIPISSMSGGQRTRIALARLLAREPEVMLLDEPTNHLDAETMVWLEEHLASYKKTVIVVSHDRLFLDRVTNKTLDVENGTAKLYKVPYTQFVVEKEKEREVAEKKYQLQQKEIARLEAYIENQRRWNRERNIIAAESREKAIARMEKAEKPKNLPGTISFSISSSGESGNDVLEAKKLGVKFPGRTLFHDLSFMLKKGQRLFIMGPNGCGKSTLIRILLGQQEASEGIIKTGYNVNIGYYAQENQNLTPSNTVLDEIWDAYPGLTQTEIRNSLALFRFRGDDIEKKVEVLSGGERARLTLCKLILSRMNLLILDEPTNHLDIGSREALENALLSFDGTVIAVSHDRYFVKKLATQFVTLSPDACRIYHGDYDSYIADSGIQKEEEETKEAPSAAKDEYLKRKAEAAERRKAERRLDTITFECEKLEKELVEIEADMFGDEAASDWKVAAELEDRKTVAEDRLMQLYEEEEALRTQLGLD